MRSKVRGFYVTWMGNRLKTTWSPLLVAHVQNFVFMISASCWRRSTPFLFVIVLNSERWCWWSWFFCRFVLGWEATGSRWNLFWRFYQAASDYQVKAFLLFLYFFCMFCWGFLFFYVFRALLLVCWYLVQVLGTWVEYLISIKSEESR